MSNDSEFTRAGARVIVKDLWKVYGPHPERYIQEAKSSAPGDHSMDRDHTAAVRGVSFDVRSGETFVVMGLSGSGKSTLIRCLTRLIEPTAGSITIGDTTVTNVSERQLREMRQHECAMVFQHFGLLPHRRVIDNVAYGLEVAGMPRSKRERRAAEVLELVGLKGWDRRFPSELSGGMRQRVGLARALAVDPKLLLLDEPFSALDPLIRRDLQDELIRLARATKQTSIFVTHDMTEALKVGDRIAIMRAGQIVQIGTPEDVVLRPVDDYVKRFAEDALRMRVIQAHSACTTVPVFVSTTPYAAVLDELRATERPYAVIVDEHGKALGTVTDSRSARTSPLSLAGDNAISNVVTVPRTAILQEVASLLDSKRRIAVVVDDKGTILGGIDAASILQIMTADYQPISVAVEQPVSA